MSVLRSTRSILPALALVALAAACTDGTGPDTSPLRGLQYVVGTDSTGGTPPPPEATGPGYFQGTVLGPSEPGSGGDTLATAPRIVGARLAAYAIPPGGTVSGNDFGEEVASVTTGADGKFVFPTLPGGTYVVTVTPPSGGAYANQYGGVWVTATAHPTSHEWPWWVVLWRK